jgi:Protein of unknown function (DUF2726)
MKTKPLFSRSEALVDSILARTLQGSGYRVFASVRLSDVLSKGPGETLPPAEFNFFTRAHVDFVITTDDYQPQPVFGIEFDGPHHRERRQRERDIIKNRLCKKAGFPLLRIGADEIRTHDEVDLLSYMLDRFLSWEREYPEIIQHIERISQEVAPAVLEHWIEEWDPALDPYFHFNCAHPFPGLKKVIMRLRSSGVAVSRLEVKPDTRFLALWETVYLNCSKDDEFWGVRHRVVIRDIKVPGEKVIVEVVREAAVRAWLPLEASVPSVIPPLMEAKSLRELEEINSLWERRLKGMWFPAIPGILPSDIAESFAEYLAFRAAEEQWQTIMRHGRSGGQPHATPDGRRTFARRPPVN